MSIAVPLALGAGQLIAGELSRRKQSKALRQRDEAIEKENRKNAISRALGTSFTGTGRQLPSGRADTSALDIVGGLSGLGSSLAFRQMTKQPANVVTAPMQQPSSAISRFQNLNTNIG